MIITLTIFKHRSFNQIGILFPYSYKVKEYIKNKDKVFWTATHKCFYTLYNNDNFNKLVAQLKDKDWIVNTDEVINFIELNKLKEASKQHHGNAVESFSLWMSQKRYSENTINTYVSLLKVFFNFYIDKSIYEINENDIIHFNNEYILKNNYSKTFQNQIISAIKLFYITNDNKNLILDDLKRPKKSIRLPEVLSIKEVQDLLYATSNLKHKVLLGIIYSAGLRIGEALNIKLKDVDSDRMMLRIENAKGNKDRYVPLSSKLLVLMREYYKLYKPTEYLFEGRNGGKYSQSSSRAMLKKYVWTTGIKKHVTLHTLRHSYATHLLESGTDIRLIQELLGHNSPKTTMLYTHISTKSLGNVRSPFDDLNI